MRSHHRILLTAFASVACLLAPVPSFPNGDPAGFPLYIEPVEIVPPQDIVTAAAFATVGDGLYLVETGGYGVAGFTLLGDGAPAYPSPVQLDGDYCEVASQLRVAGVAGAALAAFTVTPGGVPTVRAVLQDPADWTRSSRPTIPLGPGLDPAVAGAGEAGVVVWVDASGDLVGVRLEAAAWPAAPPLSVIAPGPGLHRPDLTAAPEAAAFLAVWLDASGAVAGRLLDAGGVPRGAILPIAPPPVDVASVSWDGARFVVVLTRPGGVEAVRLAPDGTPLDPSPIAVAGPGALGAWAGSRPGETLAVWITGERWQNYQVRAARIDPAGNVLDPGGVLIHEEQYVDATWGTNALQNQVLSVVWRKPSYELLWAQNRSNCWGDYVFEYLLTAGLTPGDPPVTTSARFAFGSKSQWGLVAAPLGDSFWTAWVEHDGPDTDAGVGARWTLTESDVTLLDPGGITFATANHCYPRQETLSLPAVASGGAHVLTALRFLDAGGYGGDCYVTYGILDESGKSVGSGYQAPFSQGPCTAPVAASDGRRFIIAYAGTDTGHEPELRWFGVDETGTPLGDGYASAGPVERVLAAASNGTGYLVGWLADIDSTNVALGRFTPDFALLEPLIALPAGANYTTRLELASDGNGYLAVWADSDTLRAARLTSGGQVLDPVGFPVASRTVHHVGLSLAWDGTDYVLAWIDEEIGESVVRIRRITTTGDVLDPEPVEGLRLAERGLGSISSGSRGDGLTLVTVLRPYSTGHGFLYRNPDVVPVTLTSFTAVAGPGSVILSWTTGWEADVLGFHVLRAAEPARERAHRVTPELIAAGQRSYAFADQALAPGSYWYWLEELASSGERVYHGPLATRVGAPTPAFWFSPGAPNPFRGSTAIAFSTSGSGPVSLAVFDVRGNLVRSLIRGDIMAPGEHRTAWDGRDGRGRPVPSGVYLARLEAGGRKAEQKLHVIH